MYKYAVSIGVVRDANQQEEEWPMGIPTGTRRVNANLPTDLLNSVEKISASSGCNLTELIQIALALMTEAYATQEAGGQILLTDSQGQPSKALQLPTKTLRTITFSGAQTPAFPQLQGDELTGTQVVSMATP